jgi:hypothetical protein
MTNLIDVEAIDLDELDLHAAPRSAPTIVDCDNNLE